MSDAISSIPAIPLSAVLATGATTVLLAAALAYVMMNRSNEMYVVIAHRVLRTDAVSFFGVSSSYAAPMSSGSSTSPTICFSDHDAHPYSFTPSFLCMFDSIAPSPWRERKKNTMMGTLRR